MSTIKFPKTVLALSTGRDELVKAVPLGLEGFPTKISVKVGDETKEIPVSYFEKEVLEVGEYEHPTTGEAFAIDAPMIDHLVDKFNQMRAQGIEIHCPVDHSDKAEDNRGFVMKLRRDGGKLSFTSQVFGDDGALTAVRNRCSAQITPNFRDEKGRNWGPAIEHIAFTPIPVITGQGSFVPIAASRGEQAVTKTLYLSASKGSPDMDITKLREAIGAAKEITDQDVIAQAVAKLGEGKTAAETLQLSRTKIDSFDAIKQRAETAETERDAAKAKVLELSKGNPDASVLEGNLNVAEGRLQLAIERGQCTEDMARIVRENFLKPDGKPGLMLSRSPFAGPVDGIFKLLELNKALKGFQQTDTQVVGRHVPGGGEEQKTITIERLNELRTNAGLPPVKAA